MNFKKLESYLAVNLLGPGPRLLKREFTGPRSHKGWETLPYATWPLAANAAQHDKSLPNYIWYYRDR